MTTQHDSAVTTESRALMPQVVDPHTLWLAKRMTGVGASEASAVLGLSPFLTPLELYLIKHGVETRKPTRLMRWGNLFQTAIAEAYSEETNRKLILAVNETGSHRDAPWMMASPDAIADDRLVEIKKVSQWNAAGFGDSGTQDIPIHYKIQCNQQMAVWEYDLCDLAALIGDDDFRIYTIRRDDRLIAQLIEAEREFMDRVRREDPPLPDFDNPRTVDILALFEPKPDTKVALGPETQRLAEAYQRVTSFAGRCKKAQDFAKSRILAAMGSNETAILPNGVELTRSLVERSGYTVQPSSYFQFKIKQPKAPKEPKRVTSNRRKKIAVDGPVSEV